MTYLLKEIFKLIKILNSENGTNQIAFGLTLGFILGFSPFLSLQGLLILLLILIIRVQAGAAFLAALFFSLVAYALDPVFHAIGSSVLTMESLAGIFTSLYNMPLVPFTRFNNSVVMGAGIFGIILSPIMFYVFKFFVSKYRKVILERFQQTKFWKAVKATSFYKWYLKYDEYFG